MGIIACRFFIKSNLLIPDNLAFRGSMDSRDYCVAVNKRNVSSKQSFSELLDGWNNDSEALRSELTLYNDKNESFVSQEIYLGTTDIFKHGYIEHDMANIILVMFDDENNSFTLEERKNDCTNIAAKILHNFIDVYRYSSQIGTIPNAKNLISPLIELTKCDGKSLSEYDDDCTFRQFDFNISEQMRQGIFNGAEVGNDILNKFAINLLNDKKIEIYEKFIVDAREQAFVKKDYCMSIVLIETAFETYLKHVLQFYCAEKGILSLESPFKKGRMINYINAISNSNVKNDILYNYFVEVVKLRTKDTQEFKNWNRNTYKVRNKIVHNGDNHYGIAEAEEAFVATIKFMEYIS